jgi:F1F0 ATPase subunit 2
MNMATHEALGGLMAAPLGPVVAFLVGLALGLVFYAGLWWTVRRAAMFRRPGLSVLTSLLLRMSVTLTGFYLVAGGEWVRLLLCLAAFVLARAVVSWLTRLSASEKGQIRAATGVRHAP